MSRPNFDQNLIRKKLQPETSGKQMVIFFVLMLLLFAGYSYYFNYYQKKPQYVLPPKFNTENQTYDMVLSFIKSDDTDTIPYKEGFNCWDSVFRVWLNARWQGISALPVAIQYEEPPGHMVIGFPTIDRNGVIFETQNDQQIKLVVGKNYNGRKVRGFYILDFTPIPLVNSPEYDTDITFK